ncbi:MAG: FAD-dependent oxidoreductase [Adlercreutzia sp.]
MKSDVSRRSFLKGAGLAAAATAAVGISGCAPTSPTEAKDDALASTAGGGASKTIELNGQTLPASMAKPDPVPEDEIASTIDCDVLVIGAGISGCPAAAIAADKGAKVICVEKGSAPCATRPTGMSWFGTKKLKELGVLCTEEEKAVIVKDIFGGANATSKQDIVRLWLDESGEAGDYLTDIIEASGIPVRVGGYYGYYKHFDTVTEGAEDMKKTGGIYNDSYWNMYALQHQVGENEAPGVCLWGRPDLSDADWLTPIYQHAVDAGAEFLFNTTAEQLEREEGWEDDPAKRVTGCVAKGPDGYVRVNAAKGVVLATGGFDWDDEMVDYYYPIGLRTCRTWQKWMTGDGHKMGVWVGAKMEDPGQYVSHMMGTVAPAAVMRSDERMMQTESQAFITPWVEWALPSNALAPVLYVNQKGERFMNEEIGYFMSGPTIDKQPEGLFWAFWDGDSETKVKPHKFDRLVDGIDTDEHSEMMVEAGLLIKADTIDELIEKMNAPEWDNGKFDGEKFKETLARYNELCAAGSDDDFYKPAEWMTTIDTPPFYAAEMGSSWMTTVGGLEIDTALHVLDVNRQAIPGLYAGGNPAGCFYGNIYAPQVPMSLSGHSTTLSYVAARNCVDGI